MIKRQTTHLLAASILAASLYTLTSCQEHKVYHAYAHMQQTEWNREDSVHFMVPAMKEPGRYQMETDLRITRQYPFMGMTLIIDRTVISPAEKSHLRKRTFHADTIHCQLTDKSGRSMGRGVSYLQYEYPVSTFNLNEGDSMVICVRHNMKQETLAGVSDIGVSMKKVESSKWKVASGK